MDTHLPIVERLFQNWQITLGPATDAYRNHVYRVFNLTRCLCPDLTDTEQRLLEVAAACHDVGIWLDGSFDYLTPSADRASAWLSRHPDLTGLSLEEEQRQVRRIIHDHHKIRPSDDRLANAFRKADWADVTGLYGIAGIPTDSRRQIREQFPSLGFRRLLFGLGVAHARRHPLSPLPMLRW